MAGFLQGELAFTDIVPACRGVLEHHDFDPSPTLEELIRLDDWAQGDRTLGMHLIQATSFRRELAHRLAQLGHHRPGGPRAGHGDLRPRAGTLSGRQGVRREVREVLSRLRYLRPQAGQFRWGETEYGIGILPLGGYVKMLGQDDNPTKAAEEFERAKLARDAGGRRHSARGRGRRPRPASSIRAATWPRACPSAWRSFRPA